MNQPATPKQTAKGTALIHTLTPTADLPAARPKPTSLSDQSEATLSMWSSPTAHVGVWECEPGEFTADRSDAAEICHIISGSAEVKGEDGTSADIEPGSLLILPQGWRGTWTVRETVRKSFILIHN